MQKLLVVILFGSLMLTGCNRRLKTMNAVRDRASFELNCPQSSLNVLQFGDDDSYGVKGCGQRMTCREIPFAGVTCNEPTSSEPSPGP